MIAANSRPLRVKFILPALTEATGPYWRPIKYSLFPPLGLATLAAYLSPDDHAVIVDEHLSILTMTLNWLSFRCISPMPTAPIGSRITIEARKLLFAWVACMSHRFPKRRPFMQTQSFSGPGNRPFRNSSWTFERATRSACIHQPQAARWSGSRPFAAT